jgi:hypothetical protein
LNPGGDEEDHVPPSEEFLLALANLISEQGVPERTFYEIGTYLALHAPSFAKKSSAIARSPHGRSLSGDLVAARADGWDAYFEKLKSVLGRVDPSTHPWIDHEIEGLVAEVFGMLTDDDADEDRRKVGVSVAFDFVSNGIKLTTPGRIGMVAWMVGRLPLVLEEGSAPSDSFHGWLASAKRAVDALPSDERNEHGASLQRILGAAGNVLGHLHHQFLVQHGSNVEDRANELLRSTGGMLGKLFSDRSQVNAVKSAIVGWCDEALSTYRGVIPMVEDAELRRDMQRVQGAISTMRDRVRNI